ncbi:MAG TPA: hypothetical protein VH417_10155 [Vicinamibacterales bacterium]|jgi:post-segregation antitoxin (ccd killing protein)
MFETNVVADARQQFEAARQSEHRRQWEREHAAATQEVAQFADDIGAGDEVPIL